MLHSTQEAHAENVDNEFTTQRNKIWVYCFNILDLKLDMVCVVILAVGLVCDTYLLPFFGLGLVSAVLAGKFVFDLVGCLDIVSKNVASLRLSCLAYYPINPGVVAAQLLVFWFWEF